MCKEKTLVFVSIYLYVELFYVLTVSTYDCIIMERHSWTIYSKLLLCI